MKTRHEKNVEPLHMLPRFDSQTIFNESHSERISKSNSIYRNYPLTFENLVFRDTANESRLNPNFLLSQSVSHPQLASSLLPRFHSNHRRYYYDENQSADTAVKTTSQTKMNLSEVQETDYRSKKFDIKFLERAYDRSGKKCRPAINTNIGKFDLEYAYEIVGDTLESYIRYRKLNQCKALSNFTEYRNKVYKREKIAQYASSETKGHMEDMHTKQTTNIPTKIIKIEEKQSPLVPTSPSTISEVAPPNFVSSSSSAISETSQNLPPPITKEAFIPIPSPDLLKSSAPKQSHLNVPNKTTSSTKQIKMKQTSSPSIKGPSQPKPNVTFKSKTVPKKTLTKTHNQTKAKHKSCIIL